MSNGFTYTPSDQLVKALPTDPKKRHASIIKLITRGGPMLSVKVGSIQEPIRAMQALSSASA